jgi:uncharacterized protein (TIGR02145 family)
MAIVQIGSQFWTKENLAVESFQDGTPITECSSSEQWAELASTNTPAWCYYNFDPSNEEEYGKLYNYYVVSSSKSIAPSGFRMPSLGDYNELTSAFGGNSLAGKRLKNNTNWNTIRRQSGNGDNQSGFTGNPSGYIKENGEFWDFGWSANYWTSDSGSIDATSVRLYWSNTNVVSIPANMDMGLAIRLIFGSGSYTGSLDFNPSQDF